MTATAFIRQPHEHDLADATPVRGRPQLRVVSDPVPAAQGDAAAALAPVISIDRHLTAVEVYRRRRFVAALAITIVVVVTSQLLGISMLSFGPFAGTSDPAVVQPAADDAIPAVHIVRPGDTYGAIAAELGADHPATFADRLRRANGGARAIQRLGSAPGFQS